MPDRSQLVRTPITDRTGKQTTVYRKPDAGSPAAGSRVPAPTIAPLRPEAAAQPTRAQRYAERLDRIRADNETWGPEHPKYREVFNAASIALGALIGSCSGAGDDDVQTIAGHVSDAFETARFAQVATADLFGGVQAGLAEQYRDTLPSAEELADWQDNLFRGADDYVRVLRVSAMLQTLELIELSRIPDDPTTLTAMHEDARDHRFIVHLMASAQGAIDYRDFEASGDYVRLLDEFPEELEAISQGVREGLHAGAIRAKLDGGRAPALLRGEL